MTAIDRNYRRLYVVRWMIAGAVFGAFLTLIAWRLTMAEAGSLTFAELHQMYPALWIVDLAPTVLGVSGAVIGVVFTRMAESKQRIEETAQEMAASWIAELHATNAELAEALESRRTFSAAVTHELRTPLASILGFTELVGNGPVANAELVSYLAEIEGAAIEMQDLVNNLLDGAKLEKNGIAISVGLVSCEEVIAEVVGRMKPLARQKGIDIAVDVEDGLACRADPVRLRQVLTNVVANAVKYSERGTIEISGFRQMAGTPVIAVKDEGIGIGAEDQGRVFGAFESGANGAARRDSTGLGLAISASLVKAMGGEITVRSDGPGHGSTFQIKLQTPNHQAVESRTAQLISE